MTDGEAALQAALLKEAPLSPLFLYDIIQQEISDTTVEMLMNVLLNPTTGINFTHCHQDAAILEVRQTYGFLFSWAMLRGQVPVSRLVLYWALIRKTTT